MKKETTTFKIPASITLPGDYLIKIKFVSKHEMEDTHGDSDGCWDPDTHTIWMGQHLSAAKRDYVFRHEIGHAWNDWCLYFDYTLMGWDTGD